MKKRAYIKNQIKTIFKTKARFLSIFFIVFLGTAFFAGLRHTPIIMEETMNDYLQEHKFNDLNYIGTLGFNQEDIDSIKDNKGIESIEFGYRFDALINIENARYGVTVYSSENYDNEVNQIQLMEGRKPTESNECLIDYVMVKNYGFKLGDKFKLSNNNGEKEFTIVGVINDPRYISDDTRGKNTLGDGNNAGYIEILTSDNQGLAIPQELLELRNESVLYNDLRITLKEKQTYNIFSDEYDYFVEEYNNEIESVLIDRYEQLHTNLVTKAKSDLELFIQSVGGSSQFSEQIAQAQRKIDDIPTGEVITLTNNENAGVVSYETNCQSMESLAIFFPLIFFLVAALVSLTTMTRMVEEQRIQSGTFRALGYSNKDVIMQYLIYGFLSTFFASVFGMMFGILFFPNIIYFLYSSMMYDIGAPIKIIIDVMICIQTALVSIGITLVATLAVCFQELRDAPATLLRVKAPKSGKRILLERISFIWKRLSFNQKVTMRNIFRYKKRFLMSVIGIAGCSALIVTGFGIKNSVSTIADIQYGEIWQYDGVIYYNDSLNQDEVLNAQSEFVAQKEIESSVSFSKESVVVGNDNKQYDASLEVPSDNDKFEEYIKLKTSNDKKLEIVDDGIMISAKVAELLDIEVDDEVTLNFNENIYKVTVKGVFELNFYHYIYMSETYYESLTNQQPQYLSGYFKIKDNDVKNENKLLEYVNGNKEIVGIGFVNTISETFKTQMASMDSVVVILIVFAALLAFIVLYNLTNINIQERKSEIATIKVLGFYPSEVNDYVFRENIILSFIGSIIGLGLGKIIHLLLIRTVEIEQAKFIRTLDLMSYLAAIVLTMLFTIGINFVMRGVLKKIDMVESLKSNE